MAVGAFAVVVGDLHQLLAADAPVELAEDVHRLRAVGPALLVPGASPGRGVALDDGHAGQRLRPAPAVLAVDQEDEALGRVEQQVLAPEGLLVAVPRRGQVAALQVADHLPRQRLRRPELERADAAERDLRLGDRVLREVREVRPHALRDIDHRLALAAGDRLRAVQPDLQRGAAARALDAAPGQRLLARAVAQATQRQIGQPHPAPDRPARLRGVAVVERADLVAAVAQVGDQEAAGERRRPGQFALRGLHRRGRDRGDVPGEALDLGTLAGEERGRLRDAVLQRRLEGEDVGAVVLGQPAAAAVGEERVPLVPAAIGIGQLQAAEQREGLALEDAAGAELQRRVVVEQLGALADAAQRVALAHQRRAAEAAHRAGRRGRAELDRAAAVRTRGPVGPPGANPLGHVRPAS